MTPEDENFLSKLKLLAPFSVSLIRVKSEVFLYHKLPELSPSTLNNDWELSLLRGSSLGTDCTSEHLKRRHVTLDNTSHIHLLRKKAFLLIDFPHLYLKDASELNYHSFDIHILWYLSERNLRATLKLSESSGLDCLLSEKNLILITPSYK